MATNAAINTISAATNPATNSISDAKNKNGSAAASATLAKDYQTFLTLLTVQLKNQDPTEPLDTNQMTQQLATFAGVEQQIATNKNLETLVSNMSGSQMQQMVSYIGKSIEAEGGQAELKGGQASFGYDAPAGAASLDVSIVNSAGKAVFTAKGDATAGRHAVVWDGTDNLSGTGQKLTSGVYTLAVAAKDSKGKLITTKTYTMGKVTSVESSAAGEAPVLKIGKVAVNLKDVLKVAEPAASTTTGAI